MHTEEIHSWGRDMHESKNERYIRGKGTFGREICTCKCREEAHTGEGVTRERESHGRKMLWWDGRLDPGPVRRQSRVES